MASNVFIDPGFINAVAQVGHFEQITQQRKAQNQTQAFEEYAGRSLNI